MEKAGELRKSRLSRFNRLLSKTGRAVAVGSFVMALIPGLASAKNERPGKVNYAKLDQQKLEAIQHDLTATSGAINQAKRPTSRYDLVTASDRTVNKKLGRQVRVLGKNALNSRASLLVANGMYSKTDKHGEKQTVYTTRMEIDGSILSPTLDTNIMGKTVPVKTATYFDSKASIEITKDCPKPLQGLGADQCLDISFTATPTEEAQAVLGLNKEYTNTVTMTYDGPEAPPVQMSMYYLQAGPLPTSRTISPLR
jgi:hypothetical protein